MMTIIKTGFSAVNLLVILLFFSCSKPVTKEYNQSQTVSRNHVENSKLHQQSQKQRAAGLYYFKNEEGKIGVQDEKGRIIIPAEFSEFGNEFSDQPIEEAIIEFRGVRNYTYDKNSPAIPVSEVFDRQGQFLYYVQLFDNGSDYYSEGVRRIIKDGKMGFANADGDVVIPALYDWAAPFEYGYSKVIRGKVNRKYVDDEHWIVVADKGSEIFYINKNGEKISPYKKPKDPNDYNIGDEFLPYPFSYTADEKRMVDFLNNLEVLNKIYRGPISNAEPEKNFVLQFEITERPRKSFPYYTFTAYHRQSPETGMSFVASTDGKSFYHESYDGELQSLNRWIVEQLQELDDYFKRNPNKRFRFDTKKESKIWRRN